jgi:class 3 adenylate cyclase/tetratricopeptide (TPR) repeat protein
MLGNERKVATVLFADLVGSTALAGEQDPERTRARLERFYDAMAAEIDHAGGTVEKFAGDAVMAAFGAPAALEDHAERALHTALAMQRRLDELFEGGLELRIGVNTGEVVVGKEREGSSFVSGDAVNVAARLEQAAAPGEILVGERTAAAVRGAFEFGEPATVEAKGKPIGVACRRLRRALSLMRPRGFGGLGPVFVGRAAELQALRTAYEEATAGDVPRLITLVGDAGVGKTTLVRELWDWLGGLEPEPVRRTGRCLAYGQGMTYWPLAEVLREHLGLLESDPAEEALARLDGRRILGLTFGLDLGGELHPLAARDRLQEAWVELVEEVAAKHPVVLLVEDVHWAEEPLLDLLERLFRDVRGPLLLVCTARPEFLQRPAAWGGARRGATLLHLEPLPGEDAELLVDRLLASEAPGWVREFVGRAEGNPFFVEELLRTLIDQGWLERQGGGWTMREPPAGFVVPDSVQALVAARIDLLATDEKAALQAAAVIGRFFWSGPVYELLEGAEPDFRLLEDRDFVRRRPGSSLVGEREYAFKHALTREIAYGSLPKARRAHLHAAFARWLERLGEGRDEHAALLAHHYAEAVRPEDVDLAWPEAGPELDELRANAVKWLSRAGQLAVARYEIDEAVALLQRAVRLRPDDEALWRRLAEANALRFDGEGFRRAAERALELAGDDMERAELFAELAFQSGARGGMWKTRPESEVVAAWIERALALAEPRTVARTKALIARCYMSDFGDEEAAVEASVLAEWLGGIELRSYAFDACASSAFKAGRYADALGFEQRRFELAGEIDDPDHLHDVYVSTVPLTILAGRLPEARRIASENDELCATLTAHHRLHAAALLGEVEELAGAWQRVHQLTPRLEQAVLENITTPCVRNARALLVAALAAELLGDRTDVRRLEEAAAALGMAGSEPALAAPLIRLHLARGELDLVEPLLSVTHSRRATWFGISLWAAQLDGWAALRDRERVEDAATRLLLPGMYFEPFALRALGLVRDDKGLIERALERFEALGLDWYATETRRLIS